MDTALKWFIRVWVGIAILVNLAGIMGLYLAAPTLWDFIERAQAIYAPTNVINFVAELVLFAPAIAAFAWREKIRKRRDAAARANI
jgi:hypothetical protein